MLAEMRFQRPCSLPLGGLPVCLFARGAAGRVCTESQWPCREPWQPHQGVPIRWCLRAHQRWAKQTRNAFPFCELEGERGRCDRCGSRRALPTGMGASVGTWFQRNLCLLGAGAARPRTEKAQMPGLGYQLRGCPLKTQALEQDAQEERGSHRAGHVRTPCWPRRGTCLGWSQINLTPTPGPRPIA